jgi:predicted component of type VI protein secretion system
MKAITTPCLLFAALLLLAACSHAPEGPPMGATLKRLTAAQVIHPQASRDPAPVAQLPGPLGLQIYNNVYLNEASGGDQ